MATSANLHSPAANDSGTSFTWTPPTTLPYDSYELRIRDSVSEDYSARFSYPGPGYSSTGPSPSSTGPSPSSASTASASTGPSGAGDAGLSTGAKIGIGVAAGIVGLLLLAGITILIYRRGKRAGRQEQPQEMDGAEQYEQAKPKLAPEVEQPVYELRGSWRGNELEGHHHSALAELSAEPRSKLEASAGVYPGGR